MKTLLKSLFLLMVSTGFISCALHMPVSRVTPENNKTYSVDFLFELDGCKVYRFRDYGNHVYFTKCNGDVTSISSDSTEIRTVNIIRNDTEK